MIHHNIFTKRGLIWKYLLLMVFLLCINLISLTSAAAQVEDLVVEVKGLACPFCVRGVEKHLKKIYGVTEVQTDLKQGLSHIAFSSAVMPDVEQIRDAIVTGGFTPGEVRVTVVGTLHDEDGAIYIKVNGGKSSFILFESDTLKAKLHGDREVGSVSKDLLSQLRSLLLQNKKIRITGAVHSHRDFPAGLSIEKWEEVKGA